MEINIADKKIGTSYPPFIIAEMSGNHNQSLERALAIVEGVGKRGQTTFSIIRKDINGAKGNKRVSR